MAEPPRFSPMEGHGERGGAATRRSRGGSTAVSLASPFLPLPPPVARHLRPKSAAARRLTLAIPADGGEDVLCYGAIEGEGIIGGTRGSWCKLGNSSAIPERRLGLSELRSRGATVHRGSLDPSSLDPSTSTLGSSDLAHRGPRSVVLPPTRPQVMKPGPRRPASISSIMERS
jgi:hypothetical protein